jgi:hypothetical protein
VFVRSMASPQTKQHTHPYTCRLVSGLTHPKRIDISLGSSSDDDPHMYWTDPTEGALYRASLKGKHKEKIVTGVSSISGVACTEDRVYYTVIDSGAGGGAGWLVGRGD